VAMTANAFGEDQAACLEAGMSDHLGKPVDPERLYQTLLRWLTREGGAKAGGAGQWAADAPVPRSSAAARSLIERLDQITGFSVKTGLSCAADDEPRLVRLLRKFIGHYRLGDAELADAVTREDIDAIRSAAHSVRGACATVGALGAAQAAQELEAMAANAQALDSLRTQAQQLGALLRQVCEDIARALSAGA